MISRKMENTGNKNCAICNKVLDTKYLLKTHTVEFCEQKQKLKAEKLAVSECGVCKKVLNTEYLKKTHTAEKCRSRKGEAKEDRHSCPYCKKHFANVTYLNTTHVPECKKTEDAYQRRLSFQKSVRCRNCLLDADPDTVRVHEISCYHKAGLGHPGRDDGKSRLSFEMMAQFSEKTFYCGLCDYATDKFVQFRTHLHSKKCTVLDTRCENCFAGRADCDSCKRKHFQTGESDICHLCNVVINPDFHLHSKELGLYYDGFHKASWDITEGWDESSWVSHKNTDLHQTMEMLHQRCDGCEYCETEHRQHVSEKYTSIAEAEAEAGAGAGEECCPRFGAACKGCEFCDAEILAKMKEEYEATKALRPAKRHCAIVG